MEHFQQTAIETGIPTKNLTNYEQFLGPPRMAPNTRNTVPHYAPMVQLMINYIMEQSKYAARTTHSFLSSYAHHHPPLPH
ncbi:hypothetical protein PVAND_006110 [Polypedilum vanderplanki]|uniref:Uncharacterized protein n=1 Tax=Polypedilum vanderplanki TaxID=319348 RepID=A0A9J6C3Z4_POLVA|nr:hypothetical protein PVAND_006110 [Polypedilum vanderplanki]